MSLRPIGWELPTSVRGGAFESERLCPLCVTVSRGLRENRTQEGTHRFYRFRTPLRGRTHRFYRVAPFLLTKCNRNVTEMYRNLGSQPKVWRPNQ